MPEYVLITMRSLMSFMVLMLMARAMGTKQISHLTFFDYVVGITIGSIAASLAIDQNVKIINGLIGIIIWGSLPIILSYLDLKSYKFRQITDGHATVLIENGKIHEQNLKRKRITVDELILLLREKNAFKLADVELAILETNGQVSVMKKAESQPITAKLLKMALQREDEPRLVIIDGNIMTNSLQAIGYSEEWLLEQIKKHGAADISEVFVAQVESNGSLYVDLKEKEQEK